MNTSTANFVKNNIFIRQTYLIDRLFESGVLSYEEDIENYEGDFDESREICNWFLVEESIANRLVKQGEPVIRNHYGNWWGRTTYGQSIEQDHVIEVIVNDMNRKLD